VNLSSTFFRTVFLLIVAMLPAAADDLAALDAGVRGQIEALQAEKAGRTPAQQKMDSRLVFAVKKSRGEKIANGVTALEEKVRVAPDGRELVDLDCTVNAGLLAELARIGAEVVASVPRFHSIRARVPRAQLEALAGRGEVRFIKPAVRALTHAGPVLSQGDATHRAGLVRSTLKATGRAVKVGVISDSVDGLGASQAKAELGLVTVLPGQAALGNTGEGTAMLEIVHDLAPDADLFFATAYISEAQFAQNILDLRAAGCDIVVDDVSYFDESPFQDGPVAQAVDQIVADGALYFSAAGNEGNQKGGTSGVWEGDFADGGATGELFIKAGRLHSFGATNYDTLTSAGFGATLFWTDPLGASRNDYDLYLLNSTGTSVLAASTNIQNGHQDPYEGMETPSPGTRLVVVKAPNAEPRFLHLNTIRGTLAINTTGTILGHAAAVGAFAVAATDSNHSFPNAFTGGTNLPLLNPAEAFTSDGPRRAFFFTDGTPITPGDLSATGGTVRLKPDIAAADGVSTSVPGFAPFYGTSAAAPHAAAIAALVWSRNRQLTSQQVRTALTSTALDTESVGFDNVAGAGIVDALAAAQAVAGGVIVEPSTPVVTAESFLPANNVVDPGETITVSLTLTNVGAGDAGDLIATLLPTGGVSNPSSAQSYGALATNTAAAHTFTFQANGAPGGKVTLTFRLTDGATFLGTTSADFAIGVLDAPQTFSNLAAITIPNLGVAAPYPSNLTVTGINAPVGKVTVKLLNYSHTYSSDVDVLLVSPTGRKVVLMSNAGGDGTVSSATLTFDDDAPGAVPDPAVTGTYRPSGFDDLNKSLNAPAPAAPYADKLGRFAGDTANGTWKLYVRDEFNPDSGSFAGGWSLIIRPVIVSTNGPNADLSPVLAASAPVIGVGEAVTFTATVYNNGPAVANAVMLTDDLPAALSFDSAVSSQGTVSHVGNQVTASLGSLPGGASATVTIVAIGASAGAVGNTVNVSLTGTENTTANNAATTNVTVGAVNLTPVRPAGWSEPIVVSTVTGSNTNADFITSTDSLFVDAAFINAGSATAHGYFTTQLFVDGVLRRTFDQQLPLIAGSTVSQEDIAIGTLPPGSHSIVLKADAAGEVVESNENDNLYTKVVVVQAANLAPVKPAGWSDKVVLAKTTGTNIDSASFNSTDTIFLDRALTNNGTLPAGVSFATGLYLDDVLTTTWTTNAIFGPGAVDIAEDFPLGPLAAGVHTVRIVIDTGGAVPEIDETDNEYTRTFVVNGAPVISDVGDQSILEDSVTEAIPFTIGDNETASESLVITAASSDTALVPTDGIVIGGTGANRTVQVTPAANRNGDATITLTVADDAGGSATDTFIVHVASLNDTPSFIAGGDQIVLTDSGPQTVPNWAGAISAGPVDEAGQAVNFIVTAAQPALFSAQPAIAPDGTLTYTPADGAAGSTTVDVRIQDDGSTSGVPDTSAVQTFTITLVLYHVETGTYHGLAKPAGTPLHGKTGLFRLTVGARANCTGRLRLGSAVYRFKGRVLNTGQVLFGRTGTPTLALPRHGQAPLTLSLRDDTNAGTDKVTGSIKDGPNDFATIDADRALYTARANAAAPFKSVPPDLLGKYTAVFDLVTPLAGAPAVPGGSGIARLTLGPGGMVIIAGTLQEGTKFSYANALSKTNVLPFFLSIHRKRGSVSGPIAFRDTPNVSDLDGLALLWFRPMNSRSRNYSGGWPGGVSTNVVGSRFVNLPGQSILPGLTTADSDGNVRMELSDGGLAGSLPVPLVFATDNKIAVAGSNTHKVSAKAFVRNGVIAGKFTPIGAKKPVKFKTVILQKQSAAYGFFFGRTGGGAASLLPDATP
jgi:uncharacterized repeat protein (TIGR01451 family)